ncbi:MAG TPA: c-type cytochrome, partial [Verrucomicrobiae bacterium]|nr:c-type cytochrome [Verrucomicrobiae bacterium]
MKTRLIPLLVVMLLVPRFAHAAETWTDDRLPVRDGLELWFDCARQNAGRSARQLPPIASGNPADYLIDGSGRGRNLTQAHPEYRPRFRQEFNGAFLSFDGQDDVLGASRLEGELTDLTLFVVAAPRSNAGGFRGLVAWSRAGGNDYTTGLCLGYSLGPTLQLAEINAEGAGFSGAAQLKQGPPTPFGVWHVFSLESQPGGLGTKLAIDGKAQGARGRDNLPTSLNEFTLGARHYSNTPEPPFTQGFYHGEIAEVLVYGRVLDVTEKAAVQRYLDTKHGLLLKLPPSAPVDTQQLVTVTNPPAIQMLVPGFAAFQLPVSLNNINNVKYRADGKLVAVGYNGHIHLLSNTEGDGSGTRVTPFWTNNTLRSPIGMALTPPGYARGEGVFVAGKGKVSLIVDTNRDDHADAEIVVAEGWEELVHSVDALGIAVDRDGSVYFGLGTASYTEAYRVDKATGQSRYSLKSERGTILKVSPDFKKREIVCTGIRFPIGMAFNEAGDLFSTDQEGATWLPNGNPFDELLHIQTGRHYGFPPRHPRYLTGVIDEPSVYDYGPQHQSTCGLNFNLPVNGGPAFGPAWWAGDAIVCGYSRGKIWRTKLVKTAAGYVAQNQQIASLSALTVDACVSPDGGLLVATHSGEPDWGSGPNGPGQLYKIIHDPGLTPLPVLAWNEGPGELRVAFDRPVNAAGLTNLARLVEITRGQYVFAGDRFEVKRPGYATVYNQLMQPRRAVPVLSASLTPDLRTLVFQTAPREMAVNYAVTLHRFARGPGRHPREVGQHPDVDLLTDLSGLEAHWRAAGEPAAKWDGWLPHVDLTVAREFTRGSAGHDSLWPLLQKPGKLALRGQLDLKKMLQPAVQPGSTLDYEPPPEDVTVVFSASAPFLLVAGGQTISSQKVEGVQQAALRWRNDKRDWLAFKVTMPTSPVAPTLTAHWFTADDPRPRAFPLRRILVPWAKPESGTSAPAGERKIPELAGGNWLRGKQLFFGEVATCYKCHTVRGAGAKVGPDLSNLIHRDYASVLKDIREPSAALNPDHLAYSVELTDGESVTGVLGADAWDQVAV